MGLDSEYDAAMLEDSSSSSSDASSDEQMYSVRTVPLHKRKGTLRPGLLAAAGIAVVGAVLLLSGGGKPLLKKANAKAATVLSNSGEDPCKDFTHLKMEKLVRNNLGRKGPVMAAQEGMVFKGVNIDPGHGGEHVDLHINALTDFEPAWRNKLGFSGGGHHFMTVNLKPGREVTLKIAAMRPGTNEPKTLRKATFTFFDLDSHGSGDNQEFVKASGSTGTITYEGTELVESVDEGHEKVFRASQPGTGEDNPTDPLHLTEQQLQRAVTFIYEPFTEAVVTLGSTSGSHHGRKFDFVGRPSLQCATGVEPDKVVVVDSSTPTEAPTCCLLKYQFINLVCAPAEEKNFFHFMC
jgi:hypothetical protein